MTFAEALSRVHAAGFKVTNLFEIAKGWQSNLVSPKEVYEFGKAPTPEGALMAALAKALAGPGKALGPITHGTYVPSSARPSKAAGPTRDLTLDFLDL